MNLKKTLKTIKLISVIVILSSLVSMFIFNQLFIFLITIISMMYIYITCNSLIKSLDLGVGERTVFKKSLKFGSGLIAIVFFGFLLYRIISLFGRLV